MISLDFTLETYLKLLETLVKQGFSFQTFHEIFLKEKNKSVVLRHDVDKLPLQAVKMAEIEASLGIKASYHFRIVKESNDPQCIKRIVRLGHEIAYHYEIQVYKGDEAETVKNAYLAFRNNLEYFRKFYPVDVISMHGSPLSSFDNRVMWKYFNYHDLGIICEPYFDIDFSSILYLTDTGRMWNGEKFNIRDKATKDFKLKNNWITKAKPGSLIYMTDEARIFQNMYKFKTTFEIIQATIQNNIPDKLIINTHPQRWADENVKWLKELLLQKIKNIMKFGINKIKYSS